MRCHDDERTVFLSGQIENALCRRSFDEAQLCLDPRGLRLQGGAVEILLPSPLSSSTSAWGPSHRLHRIRNQRNPVHRVAQDEFAFVFVREFGREIHGSSAASEPSVPTRMREKMLIPSSVGTNIRPACEGGVSGQARAFTNVHWTFPAPNLGPVAPSSEPRQALGRSITVESHRRNSAYQ